MIKKLTKVEEQVMQIIWSLGRCTVSEIIEKMGDREKIPHSTVSSVARILEKKGFLDHKAYGRTYEYFAVISQDDYSQFALSSLAQKYFGGSYKRLVSFLASEKNIDAAELTEIINLLDESDENSES